MSRPDQKERMKDIETKLRIIDEKNKKFREQIMLKRDKQEQKHPQPSVVVNDKLMSVSWFKFTT